MDRNLILCDNYRSNDTYLNSVPASVNGIPNAVEMLDKSVFDTLCPVNPVTGFRDNSLSRLTSPSVSPKEKELILNSLGSVHPPRNNTKGLSNNDILDILPSRYLSDPVEIDSFKNFVDDLLKQRDKNNTSVDNNKDDTTLNNNDTTDSNNNNNESINNN